MSELAQKLIAENKRTKATFLDLGKCGLTEVPAEVRELVWLLGLSLSDEWFERDGGLWQRKKSANTGDPNNGFTDIGPLAGLSSLATLDLSSTQVSDLTPLAGLSSLATLDLSGTKVSDLSPLAGLSSLATLDLSRTQVSDLSPLAALSSLATLHVSSTKVSDLSPLVGLSSLATLDLYSTKVSDLSPLVGLSSLARLDVGGTKVSDLTPLVARIRDGWQVKWGSSSGVGVYVKDCPLTTPPPEIVKQGHDAVLNYFRERELGEVDHLYEAKLLILGEGRAGKTSLLRRLYQPDQPLPEEKDTTKGISIHRHEFELSNGRRFRLNVWDFGGQQIYHATHQFFLTHRSLYILVDDTSKDHKSVSDEGFKYWLDLIDVFGGRSPVLIFQNEKGGRTKAIDIGGIKGRFDNVKELHGGNLDLIDAADKVRAAIEYFASNLSHIGEELPASWLKVREDIEARADETPHISQHEYFEIYGRHMEFDRTKALHLSRYLHDLGVYLHFQDDRLLARTVILQNQWATEAVFKILDDETVKSRLGRFDGSDCERLWRDSAYADMHPELLALMQRFELCYELNDSDPTIWLAPQLLPPAKPAQLADWPKPADLVLRYRYDFLPKGMISRLTVRQHRFARDPEMAWATGVLFERGTTAVLGQVLASGDEIELRARGPERKELLSVIAADLDALNESFQGLRGKVDKLVPCNCRTCRTEVEPRFYKYEELLKRKERGKLQFECTSDFDPVNVLELLDGIRVEKEKLPGWAKAPREIRIFVASSVELKEDRDAFDLYFRQQNDRLRKEGIYLEIVRWENLLDAMSETRSQDEYNKEIRECDVFLCLFGTKAGKFTEEEFDVAHRQFRETGKPRIFTFFEDAQVRMSKLSEKGVMSLFAFKAKLRELEHFPTEYTNIHDLKLKFRDRLDKLLG